MAQKYERIDARVFFRISLHPEQRALEEFAAQMATVPKNRFLVNYMVHPRHISTGRFDSYKTFLEDGAYSFEITPFEGKYQGKQFRLFDEIYRGIRTPPVVMGEQRIVVVHPNGRVFPCHGHLQLDRPIGDVYPNTLDTTRICDRRCRLVGDLSLCPVYDPVSRLLNLEKT